MEIDLKNLTDEQLKAFSVIDAEAAQEELNRRNSYIDLPTGLRQLEESATNLQESLAGMKKTAASRTVTDSGIMDVVVKLLQTARNEGIKFDEPA